MSTRWIVHALAITVISFVVIPATSLQLAGQEAQPGAAPAADPEPSPTQGRGGREGRGGRGARGPDFFEGRGPATRSALTNQLYTPMEHAEYAFGADLSSVKQLEENGTTFRDFDGQVKPVLEIFRNSGYNWIRIRTCVEPATLPQDADYTIALAKAAKAMGYKWLLDFHYTNSWADPRAHSQQIPTTWRDKPAEEVADLLYEYTRDTIAKMAAADVLPDIVQVGNEIGNGILFPLGHVVNNGQTEWDNLARFLQAGVRGVRVGAGNHPMPKIMIHVDHGGDWPLTENFFDRLNSYDLPYDLIGFSFYPWSHGRLYDLKTNLFNTAKRYGKDVMVVETGYYYVPNQFTRIPGPFPETPEGQAQLLEAINKIVMDVPGNRGKGVFWWEPAGGRGLRQRGFFDNEGNPQPALEVFHEWTRPVHRVDNQ